MIERPNTHDQITLYVFHSSLVEVQTNARCNSNVASVVCRVDNAIHWICPVDGEQSVFLILNYLPVSVYLVASTIQCLNN